MQPEINIPQEAEERMEDARRTLELVRDYEVVSTEQYTLAGEQLAAIKTKSKELDAQRKNITKPLDETKRQIMDLFREPLSFLAEAERTIKRGMAEFHRAEEARGREEQRQAEEAARKERERLQRRAAKAAEKGQEEKAAALAERSETVADPVVAFDKPKAKGVSVREEWRGEVNDKMALIKVVAEGKAPPTLLEVNQAEINRYAKVMRGNMAVPGVRFFTQEIVSARAARA
jgi:hypothetical protein